MKYCLNTDCQSLQNFIISAVLSITFASTLQHSAALFVALPQS